MKTVYLVWDTDMDGVVSINASYCGARESLLNYLIDKSGYSFGDWKEFADAAGYDTVEAFQEAIRSYNDYDNDMFMNIEERSLGD